jgi:hypothetical protein
MTVADFLVPSFPNSIWEQDCVRNSVAALIAGALGIGNGIASASAFPNGVWEQGNNFARSGKVHELFRPDLHKRIRNRLSFA